MKADIHKNFGAQLETKVVDLLSSNFEKVIDTINELRESHQKDKEDIIEAI